MVAGVLTGVVACGDAGTRSTSSSGPTQGPTTPATVTTSTVAVSTSLATPTSSTAVAAVPPTTITSPANVPATGLVVGPSTESTAATDTTTPAGPRCPALPDYGSTLPNTPAEAAAYDLEAIHPDLVAISAYARTQPDFAGESITNDKPVRIRVWMRGDLAQHTTELQAIVHHPDRLDVVAAKYTVAQLQAIETQVVADAQSKKSDFRDFPGGPVGNSNQVVSFGLAPGDEQLAQLYVDRWGDAVRIMVGTVVYVPSGCGVQQLSRGCPDVTGVDPASSGVALAVTTATPVIAQRDFGGAALTVTDTGSTRFFIDIGHPIRGVLVYPGTTRVAGIVGGVKGTGQRIDLAPGASTTIDVGFEANRCDGGPGSAVPPGTYDLRVVLTSEDTTDHRAYLAPAIAVTVTANPK